MADIEYRANISVRVFGEVIWYMSQLSVFEVLYTHTDSINGWDVHAMRVFMGTLFLVDGLYMILFSENLDHLFSVVRKGDLDLYLAKPVNSQFMVSCRKISVSFVLNLLMVLTYLIWAVQNLNRPVAPAQILTFSMLAVCGVITSYALRFMFSTLGVVLQEAGNIQFLWYQLYRLATRPDPIYPNYLRYLILTLFPVGFFASVPSRALVEGLYWPLMIAGPALAVGSLLLSNILWERALRRYSSASS